MESSKGGGLSWTTAALLLALIADAAWIVLTATKQSAPDIQMQWVAAAITLSLLCGVAGYLVNQRIDGILIDDRRLLAVSSG